MAGDGVRTRARTRRVAVAVLIVVALGVIVASVRSASAGTHHTSAADEQRVVALVAGMTDNLTSIDLSSTPPAADTPFDLPPGRVPDKIEVVGNTTAYVLGQQSNDITVVDITGPHFRITGRIALPRVSQREVDNHPHDLVISPDGTRALVDYYLVDVAFSIDLTKNPPVISAPVRLPAGPGQAAFLPGSRTALIGLQNSTVGRIDLDANPPALLSAIRLTANDYAGVGVAPDGKVAVTTGGWHGGASVIDLTKNPPVAAPHMALPGNSPYSVTITPDSKTAYIANLYGNTVTPLALDRQPPSVRPEIGLNGGNFPVAGVITPDGKQLLVSNARSDNVTPIDLTTDPPRPGSVIGLAGVRQPYGLALATLRVRPGERTTTTLTSNLARPVSNQPVRFTATVSGTSATPVGSVTFTVDGREIGSPVEVHDGVARLTLDTLGAGSYRVSARYSGDLEFKPSARSLVQAVDQAATSTAVTTSVARPVPGQRVVVNAAVSTVSPGRGVPTGTVTVKVDDRAVGQPVPLTTGAKASMLLPRLAPGPHTVSATYNGDGNDRTSTASLVPDLDVVPAPAKLVLSTEPDAPTAGTPTILVAVVTVEPPGTGVPQGTVTFTVDAATISGPVSLVDGQAHVTVVLTAGPHHVSAAYSGATDFKPAAGDLDVDVG